MIEQVSVPVIVGVELSTTLNSNGNKPLVVGVPLTTPVVVLRVKPGGSDPSISDHVYGARPPLAENVFEYNWPVVPTGGLLQDSVSAGRARIWMDDCETRILGV